MTAPDLARIFDRVRSLLPADRRAVLDGALARAVAGRMRVLVLGEAKRGKSTLVNALFARDLLPTGALPVTAVATTVTVGTPLSAEARFLDGRTQPIGLDEVAGLVSEWGNPSNTRGVDTVRITAPSPHLPAGTEVVDTPGIGSVHRANTDESARARTTVDLAVLVVSADPPVSAAEVTLATDVMATAAAAAVVVNKTDLVRGEDLAEIVEFTRIAVIEPLGQDVAVFPLSLRTDVPTELVGWLSERIARCGERDVFGSTARALRRDTTAALDGILVEQELLQHTARDPVALVATLREILDRARTAGAAARDHVQGEARRARTRLDSGHEREVAAALAVAREELGGELPTHPGCPEDAAQAVRERLGSMTAGRCAAWFGRAGAELDTALQSAIDQALSDLATDLAMARRAAADVLDLRLSEPGELTRAQLPRRPSLDLGPEVVWRELVTSTLARWLPAGVRRKRLHRHLREWTDSAVPRPFGRARSALQRRLDETTRATQRALSDTWREQLAALDTGLAEASRHRSETAAELAARRTELAAQIDIVAHALNDLDMMISEIPGAATGHPR